MTRDTMCAPRGFTLVEIIIASILMGILAVGALMSLQSTTGFATRAGRFTAASLRALELGEPGRSLVAPTPPVPAATNTVTLLQINGTRRRMVQHNPCNADPTQCPGGRGGNPVLQLQRVSVRIDWTDPK